MYAEIETKGSLFQSFKSSLKSGSTIKRIGQAHKPHLRIRSGLWAITLKVWPLTKPTGQFRMIWARVEKMTNSKVTFPSSYLLPCIFRISYHAFFLMDKKALYQQETLGRFFFLNIQEPDPGNSRLVKSPRQLNQRAPASIRMKHASWIIE